MANKHLHTSLEDDQVFVIAHKAPPGFRDRGELVNLWQDEPLIEPGQAWLLINPENHSLDFAWVKQEVEGLLLEIVPRKGSVASKHWLKKRFYLHGSLIESAVPKAPEDTEDFVTEFIETYVRPLQQVKAEAAAGCSIERVREILSL